MKNTIGTLLMVAVCAPACTMQGAAEQEDLGVSSQALHELDVISTTSDGSLTCYRDETGDDTYTRVCIWCERADGNINGQIFCRDEEKAAPEPEPDDDADNDEDNPCAGIYNEYELAKCMGY